MVIVTAAAIIRDGRERDGFFETDDVIHYVEATTSRRADKAKDDTKKMFSAMAANWQRFCNQRSKAA